MRYNLAAYEILENNIKFNLSRQAAAGETPQFYF